MNSHAVRQEMPRIAFYAGLGSLNLSSALIFSPKDKTQCNEKYATVELVVGLVLIAISFAMGLVALLRNRFRPSVLEGIILGEIFATGSFFSAIYIWLKIIQGKDESCTSAGNVFSGIVVYVTFFTSMIFFLCALLLAVMVVIKLCMWIKNGCCGKCCGSEPILVPSSLAKIKFDPAFFT